MRALVLCLHLVTYRQVVPACSLPRSPHRPFPPSSPSAARASHSSYLPHGSWSRRPAYPPISYPGATQHNNTPCSSSTGLTLSSAHSKASSQLLFPGLVTAPRSRGSAERPPLRLIRRTTRTTAEARGSGSIALRQSRVTIATRRAVASRQTIVLRQAILIRRRRPSKDSQSPRGVRSATYVLRLLPHLSGQSVVACNAEGRSPPAQAMGMPCPTVSSGRSPWIPLNDAWTTNGRHHNP